MKRVLVTGAGGFVGGYVARRLSERGYQVVATIRTPRILDVDFEVKTLDLSEPFSLDNKVDAIVHIAGSLPYNNKNFLDYKKNNIDATQNLVNYAKKTEVKTFIYLSTIGIYGEFMSEDVDEATPIYNPDYYGITKYLGELIVRSEKSFESIAIRTPGIIGKGARGIWLTNTAEKLLRNDEVVIYTPDFKTTNFVHVADLERFVHKLLQYDSFDCDEVLLGCSEESTVRKIVDKMRELLKSKSKITVNNELRKPFKLNTHRAFSMGYESMTPLEIAEAYCVNLLEESH